MDDSPISILSGFAEKPQNCFDKYLAENKSKLKTLSFKELNFLLVSREHCKKAYNVSRFTRSELDLCVKEGLVKPDGIFAQVCNDFIIADSFFDK